MYNVLIRICLLHYVGVCDSFVIGSKKYKVNKVNNLYAGFEEFKDEYSRCLNPRETRNLLDKEECYSIIEKSSIWSRLISNPFKKILKITRTKQPGTLILIRTGESEWNRNFTFTGWADPCLTSVGVSQCEHAARLLMEGGYDPDIVYTSRLKRAIESTWIIVKEIRCVFLPVFKSWRLNERHYGSLTGLCKKETAKKLGSDVVQAFRRSLKTCPPDISETSPYYPGNQRKYADIPEESLPRSESLEDTMVRTRPLWQYKISQDLQEGNNVLVVAHANTLRGLTKIIDNIGDQDINAVTMPKGIPLVYRFDTDMNPIPPNKNSLTLSHTSGTFLEKPGLLKNAMERQKEWEQAFPGIPGTDLGKNSMEESLLKLKKEKDLGKKWENFLEPVINEDIVNGDIEKVAVSLDNEDFEEDVTWKKKEVVSPVANIGQVNIQKDPVVVLVRHGRTTHNMFGLFTGWEDPPLAEDGIQDAIKAGKMLKLHGFEFDVLYTSWLTRAIETGWYILNELDSVWIPVICSWRLNERHYGDLTGKSKKMIANTYGEDQLKKWRRGYKIKPPSVSSYDFHYPGNDKRRTKFIKDLRISFSETLCRTIVDRKLSIMRKFPKSESLKDCMDRSIPFYTQKIVPEAVAKGKRVLITSHENAIRGILMCLCQIPEEHMTELHIPNGVPLIYDVKHKCISLLDDETGKDPMELYNFGSAAQYLFRPCELDEDDDETFLVATEEESARVPVV